MSNIGCPHLLRNARETLKWYSSVRKIRDSEDLVPKRSQWIFLPFGSFIFNLFHFASHRHSRSCSDLMRTFFQAIRIWETTRDFCLYFISPNARTETSITNVLLENHFCDLFSRTVHPWNKKRENMIVHYVSRNTKIRMKYRRESI